MKVIKFKNISFTRMGRLSPVKQTHSKDYIKRGDGDYPHLPPAKKGIFAFPHFAFEYFLITATDEPQNSSGKSVWVKKDGKRITGEDWYNIPHKNKKEILSKMGLKYRERSIDYYCHGTPVERPLEEQEKTGEVYYDTSYVTYILPIRKFNHKGNVWHHFDNKFAFPIKKHGTWVLSEYKDYVNAVNEEIFRNEITRMNDKFIGDGHPSSISFTGKDCYEVFIENIKETYK